MGFGNIAAMAEKELQPHLPNMIPKLYRFTFDPNPKVGEVNFAFNSQSMKSIWRSLVRDSKKSVDLYYHTIMADLVKGLGDRMWRTRESSCNAIHDLISGRSIGELEPYLEQLWIMHFRALDDIKESVRKSALVTLKTLSNMTIRYCDPTVVSVSDGQKVINIVCPLLLVNMFLNV